jgi:hypothetical protein
VPAFFWYVRIAKAPVLSQKCPTVDLCNKLLIWPFVLIDGRCGAGVFAD